MRRVGEGVVRVVIVVTVAVVLVAAAHSAVRTTSALAGPVAGRSWSVLYEQQACLRAALRRSLPRGAEVYLKTPTVGLEDDLIFGAVLLTPWAHPTTAAAAHWTVSIRIEGAAGSCQGVGVRVRKV